MGGGRHGRGVSVLTLGALALRQVDAFLFAERERDRLRAERTGQKAAKPNAKRNKYGAVPTEVDGIRFDSKAEATRYAELRLLEWSGEIAGLELQPAFPIEINGIRVAVYIADFRYRVVATGVQRIEDVKSSATRTPLYRLKKKLVEAAYPGATIIEVGL